MNKKVKMIMVGMCVAAAALLYLLSERDGNRETKLSAVDAVSQSEYEKLVKARTARRAEDRLELAVTFQNEELPFDEDTLSYMRFAPMKDRQLEIEIPQKADILLAKREDGTKLLAYTEEAYTEYSLIQADIPVLKLKNDGKEIDDKYSDVSITVYDEASEYGFQSNVEGKIHVRGATSIWLPKKNYRIQVKSSENNVGKKYPFLGMRPAQEWILYSYYGDESKMREKLSRELWDDIAADSTYAEANNGLETEYCEVYLNNEYIGLYGLGTAIDRKTFWEEKDEERQDLLFKAVNFDVPTLEDIEAVGSQEQCKALELKYSSWVSTDMWNTIGNYVNLAYYAEDREYLEKMKEYMVIDNHIDYWLFFLASGLDDNEFKNIYFSIEDAKNNKGILMTPWDMDMSWGVGYTGDDWAMWGRNQNQYKKIMPFPIVDRMFELKDKEFLRLTKERWKELRKDIITEDVLLKRVEENYNLIYKTDVIKRERAKWPEAKYAYDVEYIENYIKKRLPYLDGYMDYLGKGEWDDGWQ